MTTSKTITGGLSSAAGQAHIALILQNLEDGPPTIPSRGDPVSIRYVATVLDSLPTLGATDTLILVALADYASDETRECFPSLNTIARRARCNRRTVQRRLRALEELGLIEVAIGGHQYGRNTASRYRLKFDYNGAIVADVEPLSTRAVVCRGGGGPDANKGGPDDIQGRSPDRPIHYKNRHISKERLKNARKTEEPQIPPVSHEEAKAALESVRRKIGSKRAAA